MVYKVFWSYGTSMHIIEGCHKVKNHKLFPLDRWHLIPSALQGPEGVNLYQLHLW